MKHCTVLLIKDQRLFMWCLWFLHNTVYRVMLLILIMSEVLNVYSVYSGLSPLPGGRLFEPSALGV